jgi:hypothetical protein
LNQSNGYSPNQERYKNRDIWVLLSGNGESRSYLNVLVERSQVEDYLVPAGASFSDDVHGTTPVYEVSIKAQARKPLAEKHPGK